MKEEISYADDPIKWEATLRENLGRDVHTKQALINFGVAIAIEAELLSIELAEARAQAHHGRAAVNFTANVLRTQRMTDFGVLAEVLTKEFNNPLQAQVISMAQKLATKAMGSSGGNMKREKDPYRKHDAILLLQAFWYEWQACPESRSAYRTQSDFAKDALQEIPKTKGGLPVVAESHLLKVLIPKWTKEKAASEK